MDSKPVSCSLGVARALHLLPCKVFVLSSCMMVNSRGELAQTNRLHRLTFQCMSNHITLQHAGQMELSHWLQAIFIASLPVQVCLSHTPSHMSDQRVASSRRRGDAGTAVATRLRLSVCSSSIWLYCNTLSAGQSIARGLFISYMCIHQSHSSHPCIPVSNFLSAFSCSTCLSGSFVSCLCASLRLLHVLQAHS